MGINRVIVDFVEFNIRIILLFYYVDMTEYN